MFAVTFKEMEILYLPIFSSSISGSPQTFLGKKLVRLKTLVESLKCKQIY